VNPALKMMRYVVDEGDYNPAEKPSGKDD